MRGPYHWQDGITFERCEDGSVALITSTGDSSKIPADEWASIVAAVSEAGGSSEAFAAARKLHGCGP